MKAIEKFVGLTPFQMVCVGLLVAFFVWIIWFLRRRGKKLKAVKRAHAGSPAAGTAVAAPTPLTQSEIRGGKLDPAEAAAAMAGTNRKGDPFLMAGMIKVVRRTNMQTVAFFAVAALAVWGWWNPRHTAKVTTEESAATDVTQKIASAPLASMAPAPEPGENPCKKCVADAKRYKLSADGNVSNVPCTGAEVCGHHCRADCDNGVIGKGGILTGCVCIRK